MNTCLLSEIGRHDGATVGGKGANLGELIRLGMRVPDGFVVAATAYAEQAARFDLSGALLPLIERQDWAAANMAASRILTTHPLDDTLLGDLWEAYRRMGSPAVAVRSSGTAEDLADSSFAGQQETFLGIRGKKPLAQAVRECWASLWSQRAIQYRHHRSIDHFTVRMAVVVQEMISSEASGVLFTVDPVTRRADHILIEVAPEPGGVVSGSVTGESYRVDRNDLTGVDHHKKRALLSREQVAELCLMALKVEEHFGCPQDIEFALFNDNLYLLQARAVTSLTHVLSEPLPPLGKPSFLDKVMKPVVDERYVVAPRPLDNIIYTRLVGAALYMIGQGGGVLAPEDEAAFRSQVWRQAYRFPPIRRVWKILLSSMIHPFRLLNTDWQGWWESGPRDVLRVASEKVDLSEFEDAELLERADRILADGEDPLNKRFDAARAIQIELWLSFVVTLAVGRRKRNGVLANLMAGIVNPTVDQNQELWQLSRLARREPSVLSAVRELQPKRLESTPEGRAFLQAFECFIEKYGRRESTCWYLSTPTWRRDSTQVWRILSSLVQAEDHSGDPGEARVRYQASRELVERRLRLYPGLPRFFRWMVDGLRRLHAFRENSHFDLALLLDALQEVAAEWGRRLVDRGLLETVDDVYYLTHDEVKSWLLGNDPPEKEIEKLVARRRATYLVADARWQAERFNASGSGKELRGIAVSPGVVRAKVRVIQGEHQFDRLQPGEVMVCPYTNPAWTPLFASAAGVVTETGGSMSHAAIVAREYGIPAVMAVPRATRIFEDGQEILIDGNRGIVRR